MFPLYSHITHKDLLLKTTTMLQFLQVLGPCCNSGLKQYRQTVLSMAAPLDEIMGDIVLAVDWNDYQQYIEAGREVTKMAGLEPGTSGLLTNSQVSYIYFSSVHFHILGLAMMIALLPILGTIAGKIQKV